MTHRHIHCQVEYLMYSNHILTTTLRIPRTHAFRDLFSLLLRYGRHSMRFEKFNNVSVFSKIRLETDEDNWG